MEKIHSALNDVGLCVIDNFLPYEVAMKVQQEASYIYSCPGMCFEAINSSCKVNKMIYRSDQICWLKGDGNGSKNIKTVIDAFDNMMAVLQKSFFRGSNIIITHKSHIQFSCYPNGSFGYKKHIDNPNNNGRLLTIEYYCNKNYNKETHGGVTRFYVDRKCHYYDVEPVFNRTVIHWSDERIKKETFACKGDIFSLTSWYFGSMLNDIENELSTKTEEVDMLDDIINGNIYKNDISVFSRQASLRK